MTYKRVDENQTAITKTLRKAGASVQSLASVGKGCPDLLVGYGGDNYLLEIKNPDKPIKDRALTEDQVVWHSTWNGIINIVETAEQALKVVDAPMKDE